MLPPLSLNAWLRYDAVERLLRDLRGVESVLEIGAGQGALGARLARRYRYLGVEPDAEAFAVARRRLGDAVRNCGYDDVEGEFDLVCAFEVLEHLQDESGSLAAWRTLVRPGGWLLVSVPGGRTRLGPSDEHAGHVRRYTRNSLAGALEAAGLADPRVVAYGVPLGYALQLAWDVAARRELRRARPRDDRTAGSGRWFQPPDVLAPLTQTVTLPFRLAQRPFAGTSLGTGLVARAARSA
ncbi:MAG: class I SAM-dependent methyltransferase [Thermoleophilia bacterium]|nr:class I SAM-dependent methyltransferase [Thermoleophilia bacterium]